MSDADPRIAEFARLLKSENVPLVVVFDSQNENWNRNFEYNLMFLRTSQNYANELLRIRGRVLLNDVFELLGMPRTPFGAIAGWIRKPDSFIDFGVFGDEVLGRLVQSQDEKRFELTLNVQGVIYNQL